MRKSTGKLRIKPLLKNGQQALKDGRPVYRLFGYIQGQKIRQQSTDLQLLEKTKLAHEEAARATESRIRNSLEFRQTWLSERQLREAEAAISTLPPGRTLKECVESAERLLGNGVQVEIDTAFSSWIAMMQKRALSPKSIIEARSRVRRFRATMPKTARYLTEITSKMVSDYCYRGDVSAYTRLGDAAAVRSFFNFCIRSELMKLSPFKLDVKEMKERARPMKEPEIHTPEQVKKLLDAACDTGHGGMVLYVVLGYWCFMRPSEIRRLLPTDFYVRGTLEEKNVSITIHVRGHKIGSPWRDTPIPPQHVPLVLECMKTAFDKSEGNRFRDSENGWKQIRARAGLLKLEQHPDRAYRILVTKSDWGQDVMRHSGMSYLYQEVNGDVREVTRRAGNSARVAFRHYLRHMEPDSYKAFNSITGILANPLAQESAQDVA